MRRQSLLQQPLKLLPHLHLHLQQHLRRNLLLLLLLRGPSPQVQPQLQPLLRRRLRNQRPEVKNRPGHHQLNPQRSARLLALRPPAHRSRRGRRRLQQTRQMLQRQLPAQDARRQVRRVAVPQVVAPQRGRIAGHHSFSERLHHRALLRLADVLGGLFEKFVKVGR
ncbi:hypothetical protein PLESTB_001253000 [Pleodorina starrii]|uniref:Uncharacterized protein n=1 Tax=Pleodorina starrii TaxID=330485 RepID=A0A9W6BTM5_9CHLO|nr:hypothetical protein PLESTB_001253000 [Pleodorina starrii]